MRVPPPETAQQRRIRAANAMLAHLLEGREFTRKSLPDDVGEYNCSLHTLASHLRVARLIPVDVRREGPRALYFMEAKEIARFHKNRPAQERAQARLVARKRIHAGVAAVHRLAGVLKSNRALAKKEAALVEAALQKLVEALPGGGKHRG